MMAQDRVVIVGGGPVGLVLAAFLAREGIGSVVLERAPELPRDLRASTFHPPTLDMLDAIGVTDALIARGLVCPTWQFRDRREGAVATFDLGRLAGETGHPYRLQCEQWKLSEELRALLKREGSAELRLGAEAMEAQQDEDGVAVTVRLPDGSRETVTGRWLVGADGAGSLVRRAVGATLEGSTIPELFLSMSTSHPFHETMPDLASIAYISDPDEWVVLLRTPTLWRVLVPADPAQLDAEMRDPAEMDRRIQALCSKKDPYEIAHSTAYRVQQRVADRYVRGRAALAGDAAHLNNPLGGMGLNGGIHDAVNLATRLGEIRRGADPAERLGLYERPAAPRGARRGAGAVDPQPPHDGRARARSAPRLPRRAPPRGRGPRGPPRLLDALLHDRVAARRRGGRVSALRPVRLSAGSGPTFGVDDIACAAASHLGLWEEEGLAVSWAPAKGGLAAMRMALAGEVDAAMAGSAPCCGSAPRVSPCGSLPPWRERSRRTSSRDPPSPPSRPCAARPGPWTGSAP